jgi:hypothetical protein
MAMRYTGILPSACAARKTKTIGLPKQDYGLPLKQDYSLPLKQVDNESGIGVLKCKAQCPWRTSWPYSTAILHGHTSASRGRRTVLNGVQGARSPELIAPPSGSMPKSTHTHKLTPNRSGQRPRPPPPALPVRTGRHWPLCGSVKQASKQAALNFNKKNASSQSYLVRSAPPASYHTSNQHPIAPRTSIRSHLEPASPPVVHSSAV